MAEVIVHVRRSSNEPLIIALVPQQPERQDALLDQLHDLHHAACRLGMYDAARWLWQQLEAIVVSGTQLPK